METLGGDGYIYGFNADNGFTGAYLSQIHQVVYIEYVHLFICQSNFNEVVL